MANEITKSEGRHVETKHIEWNALKEQASYAFQSGLLPKSITSAAQAITIAAMGKELGISVMSSLTGLYVVNGMVTVKSQLMLRLIYERVKGASITILTKPDDAHKECEVEMKRLEGNPQRFKFTLADAERAGFMTKDVWRKHTNTMLRWAAIRTGARVVFPDAIAGVYMEDELPGGSTTPSNERAQVRATEPAPLPPMKAELPPDAPPPIEAEFEESSEPLANTGFETPAPLKKLTEKQVNRLLAIGSSKGWSRKEIQTWSEKWYSRTDLAELTRFEYDKFCNHLLNQPAVRKDEKVS